MPGEAAQQGRGVCLVLGATGFVGRAVCVELRARQWTVIGAARRRSAVTGVALDVSDVAEMRQVFRNLKPSVIINATGHSANQPPESLRAFYEQTTAAILNAAQEEAAHARVILFGSAAEYGPCDEGTMDETFALHPVSRYGEAKARQFELAMNYARQGLDVVTARLFNPLGPGQDERQFAGMLMRRIRGGEQCPVIQNADWVRDWIDVRDVARAVALLSEVDDPPRVVNVCTGKGESVGNVGDLVASLAGVQISKQHASERAGQLWRSVGNPERLRHMGWRPQYPLIESLKAQWEELA